jgi:N-acyl-D-amino-acid deacylase
MIARLAAVLLLLASPPRVLPDDWDVLIRGGTIIDGSGAEPFVADLAVQGDRIAAIGELRGAAAAVEVDATGLAVSPGFIDVESSSYESLPQDGRGLSDLTQGITLTVFGEEPHDLLEGAIRDEMLSGRNPDFDYPVEWRTLGEFLDVLARRGIAENVASFTGITNMRKHVVGWDDRRATPEQIVRMQGLVRNAMRDGALGVGICLSYDLAKFTDTAELTALAAAAGESGGVLSIGLRSESGEVFKALDEAIGIARDARVTAIVNHAKVSGAANWNKLDGFIERIERARGNGVELYAAMYYYPALWTALSSSLPPWALDGGFAALLRRLHDAEQRARIAADMRASSGGWDNYIALAGKPDNVLFLRVKNRALERFQGRTLADAMAWYGLPAEEAALRLLMENDEEIWTAYFTVSGENIRRQVALPWMLTGSDAMAIAVEEPFTRSMTHPRTYGNVPRLLSDYVREQRLITLPEAVRKLTSVPARVFGLAGRGLLRPGHYADVAIFDPMAIEDHATFAAPHRYSTGVHHLFVNGVPVLKDGVYTGALPGKVLRGPGWSGRAAGQSAPAPAGNGASASRNGSRCAA